MSVVPPPPLPAVPTGGPGAAAPPTAVPAGGLAPAAPPRAVAPGVPTGGLAPAAPPPSPPPRVRGLNCPSCGGALEMEPGLRVLVCPHCATHLRVRGAPGTRRLAVEPRHGAEEAREALGRWLAAGWNKDGRLAREARVGEAFLCFLPFFRVEADGIGIALGTELRRRARGSGRGRRVETYEVDVERIVQESLDETRPAVEPAEWGLARVDLRGDACVPFDAAALERQGMVFSPAASEAEALLAALTRLREAADPARSLHRVYYRWFTTLRERLTLVYYPLWLVRYGFRGRSYQALIDAEDGRLAYGKAPGNDLYRALMLVGTQAVALLVATTAAGTLDSLEALLAVGFGAALAIAWGWRRFRWGGVVIEGSGVEPAAGLFDALRRAGAAGAGWRLARGLLAPPRPASPWPRGGPRGGG